MMRIEYRPDRRHETHETAKKKTRGYRFSEEVSLANP
jgi:hypothetical protein